MLPGLAPKYFAVKSMATDIRRQKTDLIQAKFPGGVNNERPLPEIQFMDHTSPGYLKSRVQVFDELNATF